MNLIRQTREQVAVMVYLYRTTWWP